MQHEWQDLSIRPALPKDSERITVLVSAILQEYGFECDFSNSESDLLDIGHTYLRSGGMFEIIEDEDGDLLGTYGILPLAAGMCKLRKMYLAPRVRGRGLGTYMMQRAIHKARDLGFGIMLLETTTAMQQAISLYVKSGFREIDKPAQSPRCDRVFRLDLNTNDTEA